MSDLAAHHILALTAYEPGKPEDELRRELGLEHVVKLASNENPNQPLEEIKRASRAMAEELGVKVLTSGDGSEETVIRYRPEKGAVEVDLHKTTLDEELMENFFRQKLL